RLLAELVPALVELALVPVGPLLRDVVRGVAGARGVVDEERPVWRLRLLVPNPVDRAVRHVGGEGIVLPLRHAEDGVVLGDDRVVLPAGATEEAPEVVEPQAARPAVERPGRPLLVVGRQVPLAERGGAVPVALEGAGDARGVLRPGRVVARPAAGELGDGAEP